MNYVALVEGERREVVLEALGGPHYRLLLDGTPYEVHAEGGGAAAGGWDGHLQLRVGEQVLRVDIDADPAAAPDDPVTLWVGGEALAVQVLSPRALQAREQAAAAAQQGGPAAVAVPMTGKVVSVLVREGEPVTAGQGLLVIEAMKMENELRAPQDGTVRALRAQVGHAVQSGAVVCTVD